MGQISSHLNPRPKGGLPSDTLLASGSVKLVGQKIHSVHRRTGRRHKSVS
ncbi:hypothetical protein H5410_064669 [Solanum commersonii]|uniref:Uncharacterized protein n=1 Tax=Solanum commersonii TaxID=4109 RepID=A0A9J5VYP4_SOLCO|nr:hypothetical protein H5410_064669 [Solanum commersonii]